MPRYPGIPAIIKNRTIDNTNTINIDNITPSTDFTITQNAVSAMTVVAAAAVVNTLYLKAGQVGIGTTGPNTKFDVRGNYAKAGSAESTAFIGSSDAANPLGLALGHGGSGGYVYVQGTVYGSSTADLTFQKDGGNVGIGTTSPLELLSLGTAGTTAGVLSLAGATSGKAIINVSAAAGTPTLTLPTATGTLESQTNKNVASGYAGLDANILLSPAQMYPIVEEYSNHLGATDNFTQTGVSGNGTATSDATNHEMDLSAGVTGIAYFDSKKSWTPSTKPIVVNIIPTSISVGTGGSSDLARRILLGLSSDFPSGAMTNKHLAIFIYLGGEFTENGWIARTQSGGAAYTETGLGAAGYISNGNLLTIVATSSKVMFYVNGGLVATHNTNLPSSSMNTGACVYSNVATIAPAVSVDLMDIKIYK